jgi:hypothetical protein
MQFPRSGQILIKATVSILTPIWGAYTGVIQTKINNVRAEILTAVSISFKFLYTLTQYIVVEGYQCFGRILCFFLQGRTL